MAVAFTLSGCGGDDAHIAEDNRPIRDFERLVIVGSPGDSAMRSSIAARFRQVQGDNGQSMSAGQDVLLLDARLEPPSSITDPNHAFRRAFAAGVPILVMHMDDDFEQTVHRILPTLLSVGHAGLALIIPPRAGHGYQDGAILHATRQGEQKESWSVAKNTIDSLLDELNRLSARRSAADLAEANEDSCSSVDANFCSFVQKTPLARIGIVNDFSADGACLTRDWEYVGAYVTRPILALAHDGFTQTATPQCPSQIINFFPVLYLNDTVKGAKSRVLSLGMEASISPASLSQRDGNAAFWYQTSFEMEVLPSVDESLNGIQWLANLPHSANSQHTVVDSSGWELNVSGKSNGEVNVGGKVSLTHTVSNTLSDWKYIDHTIQRSDTSTWSFTAMQGYPYAGDSAENCDGVGDVFNWAGVKCHAYPESIRYDTIPDLSRSAAAINGLAVWDLGSENNAGAKAWINLSATTRFDAVGCGRWSNSNYWNPYSVKGTIAPADDVGDYDCGGIAFLNFGDSASWQRRAQRVASKQFSIDLSVLPIPK